VLFRSFHEAAKPTHYPYLYVQYPKSLPKEAPAYSGRFKKQVLDQILDSPLRRDIARYILKGESVVWLLIKSGDKQKDDTAERMMREELAAIEKELKLPELTEEDDAYIDIDLGPKLRLSFKLLIVSREDLKEKQFLNILENWDSSVIDHKEPTAFAFFGRSRVLPAMTGEHLNPQNLLDACEYLIGPCGCQIKRENPGYDVLSTVRWDAVITGQYTLAEALPRLTTVSASAVVPMNQAAIVPAASHASATASKADGSLMRNMLMTLGGAVILVVLVSLLLQKRKNEV